ncbi:hypothetical protein [Nocardioides sp.]|uniref:fibronectin type III domain-containing protein n=1 Tax=Nocardioides sp. TaxID=35761 RepID=UPI001A23C126|nr:hypothetical protein [Nocardioides sp.]MBJ7357545.1 hypothetical protein [Nocardioides sp.]
MRASRPLALIAATLLSASGLAVVALTAPAQAATHQLQACAPGVPRPCVVSFTRNGTTPPADLEVLGVATEDGDRRDVSFSVYKNGGGGYDLGAAARSDTFSVTLDMGSWSPSIVAGAGRDADVVRQRTGGGYLVTVTARPVLLSGQCDQSEWPWRCPEADVVVQDPEYFNNVQWDAMWSMRVYNAGFIADKAVRTALYGLDYFHNFAASSLPPSVEFTGPDDSVARLVIEVANRRYLDDLSTLVNGHAEMRIPNSFLRAGYGITDPSSMTGSSLTVSGSGAGASVSVTKDPAGDAIRVLIDGMTFPDAMIADGELRQRPPGASAKVITVKRGVVTPTKVGVAATDRVTTGKARIKAQRARSRGARVTGYEARCTSGRETATGRSKTRTVVVTGLDAGRAYRCRVRALSKAGAGGYGAAKQLAARP